MDSTFTYKICIFGDAGVGKTSLIYRYITNRFIQDTKSTIGVDIVSKDLNIEGRRIRLQIWDFGGEEKFKTFLPVYAEGSAGGVFIYDITRKRSVDNIDEWLSIFRKNLTKNESLVPIMIVGAKLDLSIDRSVSIKLIRELIAHHGLYDSIECSSKTGENVDKVFALITNAVLKKLCII